MLCLSNFINLVQASVKLGKHKVEAWFITASGISSPRFKRRIGEVSGWILPLTGDPSLLDERSFVQSSGRSSLTHMADLPS